MMETNKIYNVNCLEGLKKIEDGTVDLICTDPPYCVGTTSNGSKGTAQDNNLIVPFFDLLFDEFRRVLKSDGELYINTDWRTYPLLYPILQEYFKVRNLIVWDYEWIKAGMHYRYSHELIVYCTGDNTKRKFGGGERDVWRIRPINYTCLKTKLHSAQKPVELVEKMILNSSNPGDLVLDAFLGSATTAIAAINTKRKYIGFEIDRHYFDVANRRIEKHIKEMEEEL